MGCGTESSADEKNFGCGAAFSGLIDEIMLI
jgi:hypothetical protein